MSVPVVWPEGLSRVAPSQIIRLPQFTLVDNGTLYPKRAGADLGPFIANPVFTSLLDVEKQWRTVTSTYPGGRKVTEVLGMASDTMVRYGGGNREFVFSVDHLRTEKRLLDVTSIRMSEVGRVEGTKKFNKSTTSTTFYGVPELPFVSSDKQAYLRALDYYGGEGSYPTVRQEIMTMDTRTRKTSDIGKKWFGGVGYLPETKTKMKTKVNFTPDAILQSFRDQVVSHANASSSLLNFYSRNPPRLTDIMITELRKTPLYSYMPLDTINNTWQSFLSNNIGMFLLPGERRTDTEILMSLYQEFKNRASKGDSSVASIPVSIPNTMQNPYGSSSSSQFMSAGINPMSSQSSSFFSNPVGNPLLTNPLMSPTSSSSALYEPVPGMATQAMYGSQSRASLYEEPPLYDMSALPGVVPLAGNTISPTESMNALDLSSDLGF